jgi:hypothetical protein
MCSPTLFISAAMNGMKFMAERKEKKAAITQANEQNRIAKVNRIRKETDEDYQLLQKRKSLLIKADAVNRRGRIARSQALASAESVRGVSVDRMVMDFFRQEGVHKSQILNNLDAEVFASQRNKEAYRLNQEAQSKPIPDSSFLPSFAGAAVSFAGDYYDWQTDTAALSKAKKKKNYYTDTSSRFYYG